MSDNNNDVPVLTENLEVLETTKTSLVEYVAQKQAEINMYQEQRNIINQEISNKIQELENINSNISNILSKLSALVQTPEPNTTE